MSPQQIVVTMPAMRILKFGGTSLASAANFGNAVNIVATARKKDKCGVVVSALGDTTDHLLKAVHFATSRKMSEVKGILREIFKLHSGLARRFVNPKYRDEFFSFIKQTIGNLEKYLEALSLTEEASAQTRDYVISHGEVLAAALLSSALASRGLKAVSVDMRAYLVTDDAFGEAQIEEKQSSAGLKTLLLKRLKNSLPVITGFIGATKTSIPTTLGRGGSDYTAAFVSSVVNAGSLEIWTDVDGVMSADPRQVPDVFPIPRLSYKEMLELAYFGAKVIHPKTLGPAIAKKIPVWIKNTSSPEKPGTLISSKSLKSDLVVKGITSIENAALLTIVGRGLLGVPGMARRFFSALSRCGINVMMISQSSSEQNICCVVDAGKAETGIAAVKEEFEWELKRSLVQGVECIANVVVIAMVGEGMKGKPGIAGRLFSVLGRNNINVIAIAQGSSEINISFVISKSDERRALNLIHGSFHLSAHHINLFVIGKGTIGGMFLDLIRGHRDSLLKKSGISLRVVGVADSARFIFEPKGIAISKWRSHLKNSLSRTDIGRIVHELWKSGLENLVIVDATADEKIAMRYAEILRQGISIVTPNKKANTLSTASYNELMGIKQKRTAYYAYETSVGAGLPVIGTLRDLIDSGDDIIEIKAVLSGTLSYIFHELNAGVKFSAAVRQAKRMGLTEPDPRTDLSGEDVARKILILAREIGIRKELGNIKTENLIGPELRKIPLDRFMKGVEKEDEKFAAIAKNARKMNCKLQYVGAIKRNQVSVGLSMVPADSPFGGLTAKDNMVAFKTRRYFDNRLVVQGPGAGPEVTAAGVLADVIKVAQFLRR